MNLVLLILLILILPYPVQWLSTRYQPFKFMGAVINCFLFGFAVARLLPGEILAKEYVEPFCAILVTLGICCMLFCTDVFKWLKVSLKVLLSFVLSTFSVVAAAVIVFFLRKNTLHEPEVVSAMLTGAYTGGVPNMTAVHTALKQPLELNFTLLVCDVIASTAYLLFILVIAKHALKWVLPPFKKAKPGKGPDALEDPSKEFYALSWILRLKYTLITLGLSALCTLVPLGIIMIKDGNLDNPDLTLVMVILTILGVSFSFVKKIRELPGNFETGEYLFCMFFFAFGLGSDFSQVREIDMHYLMYTCMILFGSVLIHFLLSWLCKIDRDTFIITSVSGIMSPPFVPLASSNLKNRELLVPGITVGIIGLAIGNILGLTVYRILSSYM